MKHTVWKIDKNTKMANLSFETDDDERIKKFLNEIIGIDQIYIMSVNQK